MPKPRKDERLELRLEHWVLKGIDEYRRDLPDIPNRSEAARRLIVYGLNAILEEQPDESLDEIRKRLAYFIEMELPQRRKSGLRHQYHEFEGDRGREVPAAEQPAIVKAVTNSIG